MVLTVLLVKLSIIDLGEVKDPLFRKPRARSVAEAVMPLAKLYVPPEDELERTPVPVVPAARVVAVVPLDQSAPILKPVGSVAVAPVPMPSKFSVNAVPVDVMLIWAWERVHVKITHARRKYNFLIVHFWFYGNNKLLVIHRNWRASGNNYQYSIFGGGTVLLCQRYKPCIIQMLPFSGNYKKSGLINTLI